VTISKEIQEALDIAYDSMLANIENCVSYFYRKQIYQMLMINSQSQGQQIFKKISLLSARYVLPIWQSAKPTDKTPEMLLDMADEFIKGTVSFDVMRQEADAFWDYMEEFGSTPQAFSIGKAFYAGTAVTEATMEVLGKIPYEGIIISKEDNDLFLDIWRGDTVFWAANAYAGRFGDPKMDQVKAKFFWTWWLKDAIPHILEEEKS
jgi:Immunity protein Imm5